MKRAEGEFLDKLKRVKRKSQRRRWTRGKQIYEEDTQHGDLEKYNQRGKHEGSVDPRTGEITKGPVKGRMIEK
jgi:Cytotoxic